MISNTHYPAFDEFREYCLNKRPLKKIDFYLGRKVNYIFSHIYKTIELNRIELLGRDMS